jgi:hypothetical protein
MKRWMGLVFVVLLTTATACGNDSDQGSTSESGNTAVTRPGR